MAPEAASGTGRPPFPAAFDRIRTHRPETALTADHP